MLRINFLVVLFVTVTNKMAKCALLHRSVIKKFSTTVAASILTLAQPQFAHAFVSSYSAPRISSYSAPRISSYSAPRISSFSAPRISSYSAPRISSSTAPRITSSTAPRITSSPAPRITSSTTPRITSSTAPRITSSTAPRITSNVAPVSSNTASRTSVVAPHVSEPRLSAVGRLNSAKARTLSQKGSIHEASHEEIAHSEPHVEVARVQAKRPATKIQIASSEVPYTSSHVTPRFNYQYSYSMPHPQSAYASPPRIYTYKSGKTPYIDGEQSKDKDKNTVGSRKETSFLRAMSDCKTKCQQPGEGLAKNDCVQDCQDQVCNSYEQCSFKIKSTAGNAI